MLSENELRDVRVPQILKTVNMKNVVYWVAESWIEGSNSSLSQAWKKLLPELVATKYPGNETAVPSAVDNIEAPDLAVQSDDEMQGIVME